MSVRQAMTDNNSNKITLKIDPNRREIMVNGSRKCRLSLLTDHS